MWCVRVCHTPSHPVLANAREEQTHILHSLKPCAASRARTSHAWCISHPHALPTHAHTLTRSRVHIYTLDTHTHTLTRAHHTHAIYTTYARLVNFYSFMLCAVHTILLCGFCCSKMLPSGVLEKISARAWINFRSLSTCTRSFGDLLNT